MAAPLDPGLNCAIIDITRRILPRGYEVASSAPSSFEELQELLQSGSRLKVWPGGSEQTVYTDPEINHAFRAWHDWSHWIAAQPFTLEGERAVSALQCRHILMDFGDNSHTRRWRAIVEAEVIGQNEYRVRHRRFPLNQVGFVLAYLDNPSRALDHARW